MKQFSENYKIYISHYQNNLNLKAVCHTIITAKLYVALGWGPKGEKMSEKVRKKYTILKTFIDSKLEAQLFSPQHISGGSYSMVLFYLFMPYFQHNEKSH